MFKCFYEKKDFFLIFKWVESIRVFVCFRRWLFEDWIVKNVNFLIVIEWLVKNEKIFIEEYDFMIFDYWWFIKVLGGSSDFSII